MIKQLHSKNTTSRPNVAPKLNPEMSNEAMLSVLSSDLMQPREQAIAHIMAQAKRMKSV
jgi:hypothetical protein